MTLLINLEDAQREGIVDGALINMQLPLFLYSDCHLS